MIETLFGLSNRTLESCQIELSFMCASNLLLLMVLPVFGLERFSFNNHIGGVKILISQHWADCDSV